ncbi:MAG: hypothetical protein ACKV22_12435 [Bryobacteraceae bacterium]
MKARALAEFFRLGVLKTIYQICSEESARTGTAPEQVLQKKLGSWYDRRITFDTYFEGGQEFRYATLWLSGPGCQKYGAFCIVLQNLVLGRAYVRKDSLAAYFSTAGNCDFKTLSDDLATEPHRHHLAAVKHATDLPDDDRAWDRHLCNKSEYIEAILAGDPGADSVGAVMTTPAALERYHDLAFRGLTADLSVEERAELTDVSMIEERLRTRKIRLEVADD